MSGSIAQLRSANAIRRHAGARRSNVLNFRDRQLRRIVEHAYHNVPYYRALYDEHGVHPDSIRGAEDLPLYPPCTRRIFARRLSASA